MDKKNIKEWLEWIKCQHSQEIDLSLDRVSKVASRLNLLTPDATVITVGGTNGKGSTVSGLEAIYLAAHQRVGAFTSPFLVKYNEQIRIQGQPVSDLDLCDAFEAIARAAVGISLTSFEIGTLAAFYLFKRHALTVWIIEVGLGGRLDAVNILTADVSIITSISLDHTALLGDTREAIAYEKAGIFRPEKPAICGDLDPPAILFSQPVKKLYCQNQDFGFKQKGTHWEWWTEKKQINGLPIPRLALQNMATVLMAVELLQEKVPVDEAAIRDGLSHVKLAGRIQVIPGPVTIILDVAHNPASAEFLAKHLSSQGYTGKLVAVFSMLGDKDIAETLRVIQSAIDDWEIAPMSVPRAASLQQLQEAVNSVGIHHVNYHSSIEAAFLSANQKAHPGDCIVVFGSFYLVGKIMEEKNIH